MLDCVETCVNSDSTGVIVKRLAEMYCAIIAFIQAVNTLWYVKLPEL